MSDSLPFDPVAAAPSAASSTDLHLRTRLGTQYNDAGPPVNSRVAQGTDETRADPGSSGGVRAAWTPFRRDLVVLGAAFLALFAAYSAIQNLETSLHPRAGMGAVSLAVIYGGIVVFAPLAPAVIRYLRPRGAMLVGMSGYCAYIAANAVDSSWVLLLSAGYLGASASVLWVAQGLYSVMLARGHAAAAGVAEQAAIAEFSGIFWGIFAANQVVGNAVTFLVCQLMALLFPAAPAVPSAFATPAAASPESLPPATVTVLIVTFLLFLALAAALTWRLTDLSEDHPLCCPAPTLPVDGVRVGEGRGGMGGEDEEEGSERGDEGEGKALLGSEAVAGRSEECGGAEQSGAAGGAGEGAGSRAKGGRSAWELLGERRLQLLLPLLLYIGLQSAFVACVPAPRACPFRPVSFCHTLPRPASSTHNPSSPVLPHHLLPPLPKRRADFTLYVVRPALGVAWIGGVMSVFGVANSLACMAAARLSSGLHSILATLLIGAACQIAVLLSLMLLAPFTAPSWVAFTGVLVQAVLWGVGDAAFQSQINALLPLVFPRDMDASFAHMKMWTSAASSLMFLLSPHLSMPAKAALLTASCAASLPLMLAVVHVP
ncbi:unnamed protein product [Closterium sp. Naga37s-1]|nr:unnamed protein product [Closterium sp. Naga37s-1]